MPSTILGELWLRGVAADPAAPSDVLLRLLDPAARAAWRDLCEERELPASRTAGGLMFTCFLRGGAGVHAGGHRIL
ncbi:hypothetical protein BIV24_08285 [Streptomyces colonosanans]|uniref:Uncharacterized protein n=1 Tax=Streptomyces colonosanans TaxID=1428652 RepID=A0A1S2PQB7_9ACTN|nr:hypothetical protein BIV24_08285 [Streptomyces colonosanans]